MKKYRISNCIYYFKDHAKQIGLQASFEEIDGYCHEWRFWDITLQKALDFFEIEKVDKGDPFA